MNVSRLTFTKETKEKMEKGINHFKKGELRWQKLQELEDTGKLSKARNRQDITSMMGLGTGYGAPYTWLSHMISRGSIKEVLLGFDRNKRPEYEYHLTNTNRPNYEKYGKANRPKPIIPSVEKDIETTDKTIRVCPETCDKVKATIKYGELTIEIESIDRSMIEHIIKTLANK